MFSSVFPLRFFCTLQDGEIHQNAFVCDFKHFCPKESTSFYANALFFNNILNYCQYDITLPQLAIA